jgi:hypothetical protein
LAVACVGCAAPNLYTTPRATPVGKFTSVVASQLLSQPELQNQTYSLQVGGRYGFAPRFDGGLRSNFASIAADLKWNAVRTPLFDFALDGGVELLPETLYVDMPLLFGVNLSEAVSLLASTGITLGEGKQPTLSSRDIYDNGVRPRRPAGYVLLRAGMGAQFRFTPRFAVVPEFTYVGPIDGGIHGTSEFMAFGIGFCFGAQAY